MNVERIDKETVHVSKHRTMNTCRGDRNTVPPLLHVSISNQLWSALSQGKVLAVPIVQKSAWIPEFVWMYWDKLKSLRCQESNSGRSDRS